MTPFWEIPGLEDLKPEPEPEPEWEPDKWGHVTHISQSGNEYRCLAKRREDGARMITGPKASPGWSYLGVPDLDIWLNLDGDDAWREITLEEAIQMIEQHQEAG